MSITVGSLVYIKTSGEPGFVLEITQQRTAPPGLSGQEALVRVPKQTEVDGVVHRIERLNIEEVETASEKYDREYNEMFELQAGSRIRKAKSALETLSTENAVPTDDEGLPN